MTESDLSTRKRHSIGDRVRLVRNFHSSYLGATIREGSVGTVVEGGGDLSLRVRFNTLEIWNKEDEIWDIISNISIGLVDELLEPE